MSDKIIVDEQTSLALKQLQAALEDFLAPLVQGQRSTDTADMSELVSSETKEVHKLANILEEGMDGLRRKVSEVAENQSELFAKLSQVVAGQTEMLKRFELADQEKKGKKVEADPAEEKPKKSRTPVKAPAKGTTVRKSGAKTLQSAKSRAKKVNK